MNGVHAEGAAGDPDDPDNQASAGFDDDRDLCGAKTVHGTPCCRPSLAGVDRCEVHLPEDGLADG